MTTAAPKSPVNNKITLLGSGVAMAVTLKVTARDLTFDRDRCQPDR
jgi:hypothetical protein